MAIFSKDDKILLTKRTPNIGFPNAWVMPGGHMDPGEDLQECVTREVYEETGIKIESEHVTGKPFFMFESASGVSNGN